MATQQELEKAIEYRLVRMLKKSKDAIFRIILIVYIFTVTGNIVGLCIAFALFFGISMAIEYTLNLYADEKKSEEQSGLR